VLAGVDYLQPIYRGASTYRHLLDRGIDGNPDNLSDNVLHKQAWGLIEPMFAERRQDGRKLYDRMIIASKTTTDLKTAAVAANDGLVSQLFVALDKQQWGRFDPESRKVVFRTKPEPCDQDLLDFVTVETLMKRGTVFTVKAGEVPDGGSVAAVLRHPWAAAE
jgi:hypothetical protein